MLFGITPSHPATLAGALVVVAGLPLLAGWLPARRAARMSPVEALHES